MKLKTRDVRIHRGFCALMRELSSAAPAVYLFIAAHTDQRGTARLSAEAIMHGCKIGDKRFSDAFNDLELKELIKLGEAVGDGRCEINLLAPWESN